MGMDAPGVPFAAVQASCPGGREPSSSSQLGPLFGGGGGSGSRRPSQCIRAAGVHPVTTSLASTGGAVPPRYCPPLTAPRLVAPPRRVGSNSPPRKLNLDGRDPGNDARTPMAVLTSLLSWEGCTCSVGQTCDSTKMGLSRVHSSTTSRSLMKRACGSPSKLGKVPTVRHHTSRFPQVPHPTSPPPPAKVAKPPARFPFAGSPSQSSQSSPLATGGDSGALP